MFKLIVLLLIITNCQADLTDINAFVRRKVGAKEYELVHGKSINDLKEYKSIVLFNTTIETLEKDDVKDLSHLQELSVSAVGLKELEPGCIHNVRRLKYLYFAGNQLTKIPAGVFDDLDVTSLSFEENQIGEIEENAFKNLRHLRTMQLSNNRIKHFNPNWFVNCRRLKELDLSSNEIEEIQPMAFQQFDDLKVLNLGQNKLKTIVSNSFVGLRDLKKLSLNSNKINTIEEGGLTGLRDLKSLQLIDNNLQCLSDDILDSVDHGCNIYLNINNLGSECITKLRQFKIDNPHIHIHY